MKTFTTITKAFYALTILAFTTSTVLAQTVCPSSFKRNNGNGSCGAEGQLRLNFAPVCPANAPVIDSVYISGVKSNVVFAAPDASHCGGGSGYMGYCVTSGNMPPTNVWTIYFHVDNGGGAFTAYSCLVSTTESVVLPVKYTSFDATVNNNKVNLNWNTQMEVNSNHFEVERSFDSRNFSTLGLVLDAYSANGNNKSYKYKDNGSALAGKNVVYYRIKQVDADGKSTYSTVLSVRLQSKSGVTMQVSPNPFMEKLNVRFESAVAGKAEIRMVNMTGQTVASKQTIISEGYNNLQVEGLNKLTTGMYVAKVYVNGVIVDTQKVIKD